MSIRYEADEWTPDGRKILTDENLKAVRAVLEDEGPIIVEHWFYRGSRSPERLVFEAVEDFLGYVENNARPGDAFHVWSYAAVCRDDNELVSGKYPDDRGEVPRKGAY